MRPAIVIGALALTFELIVSCAPPEFRFDGADAGDCHDQTASGTESDVDCGGDTCDRCEVGRGCRSDGDCANGSCVEQRCQSAHCQNQLRDPQESDVDCGGGECGRCGVSQRCRVPSDCTSNACVAGTCVATGCDDHARSGRETDVDCGGGTCPGCALGQRCSSGGDCRSGICLEGECSSETCANGAKDFREDGVDCGGSCPRPCDALAACTDGERSGLETGVDCGGGTCAACGLGQGCDLDSDCESYHCSAGRCAQRDCDRGPLGCHSGTGGSSGSLGQAGGTSIGGTGGVEEGGSAGESPDAGYPGFGGEGQGGASGTGGVPSAPHGGTGTGGVDAGGDAGADGSGGTPSGGTSASGGRAANGGNPSGGMPATTGGSATGGTEPDGCPGCARLSVPLAASGHKGNFVIALPQVTNFTGAVIRYRLFKRAGSGGEVKGYIQHGGSPDYAQLFQSQAVRLSALEGWHDLVWNLASEGASYDKTIVGRVGIQVIGLGSTSWTNPTVVDVDSITVTGPAVGPFEFDSASSVSSDATIGAPPNVLWRNSGDNPVAGAAVSWVDF